MATTGRIPTTTNNSTPLRIQLVPSKRPDGNTGWAIFGLSIGMLFAAAALVMVGLSVLHRNNVPVPALGYWDTWLVLIAIKAITASYTRTRHYT